MIPLAIPRRFGDVIRKALWRRREATDSNTEKEAHRESNAKPRTDLSHAVAADREENCAEDVIYVETMVNQPIKNRQAE